MTHGHPTQSSHQHGPHSGADPHADCGRDHRGGVHVHNHVPKDFGFAFALGTALNVGFVVLEAAAGVFANSMALLADAGHNLSDVLCLLMAWGASVLVKRRPTLQYTYGFGSSTILAALGLRNDDLFSEHNGRSERLTGVAGTGNVIEEAFGEVRI